MQKFAFKHKFHLNCWAASLSGAVGTDKVGGEGIEFSPCQRMGWGRNGDRWGGEEGSRSTKKLIWREEKKSSAGKPKEGRSPGGANAEIQREGEKSRRFQRLQHESGAQAGPFQDFPAGKAPPSLLLGDKGQHGEVTLLGEEQQEGDVERAPAGMKCHQIHTVREERRRQN